MTGSLFKSLEIIRNKRLVEGAGSILIQFDRVFLTKMALGGHKWFQLVCRNIMVVSKIQGKGKNGSTVSQGIEWVRVKVGSPSSLIASFWIASRVARECLEAPLHRWEPYSRQGRIYSVRSWLGVKWRLDLNRKISLHAAALEVFSQSKKGQTLEWRPTYP